MIRNIFRKLRNSFKGSGEPVSPAERRNEPAKPAAPVKKPEGKKQGGKNRDEKNSPAKEKRPPKPQKPEWDLSQFQVPEAEGKTRFHDLDLPPKIMHAIQDLGFAYCTPIQAGTLPGVLEGRDATGKAQTGTGKSAAFLLNVYAQLLKNPNKENRRPGVPRALILAPTRELALQIEKDARAIGKYSGIRVAAIFGGMGYEKQKRILAESVVDVIVATPGRLIDFKKQGLVRLYKVEILVIDEADRMLDMGFIPDVRQIVYATPKKHQRQTLFFSATLTDAVMRLADQWTKEPIHVEIEPDVVATETVDRKNYIVTTDEKFPLLWNILTRQNLERVMVFTNRKSDARYLSERLLKYNISCSLITGDVQQNKRIRALEDFREGRFRVLVATDVAARGIHIDGISHVVNYNLPQDPEQFVHRIGRTGRAGASGISVSFADEDDSFYIPAIEEYIGARFECEYPEDEWVELPPPPKPDPAIQKKEAPAQKRQGGNRPRKNNRNGNGNRSGNTNGRRPRNNSGKPAQKKPQGQNPAAPQGEKPANGTNGASPSGNPPRKRRRRRRPSGNRNHPQTGKPQGNKENQGSGQKPAPIE